MPMCITPFYYIQDKSAYTHNIQGKAGKVRMLLGYDNMTLKHSPHYWSLIRESARQQWHGRPSTQPGSLHTALQRKYTQPCSLFSRSTVVRTIGARLCKQWGTAVCCVQVPGCVEGHS